MSRHWKPAESVLHKGVDGLTLDDVTENSKAVSSKLHMPYDHVVPLVTPIYHSSTYNIKSVDHYLDILEKGGYIYSRLGNPTCESAEAAISALEGGAGSMLFASGMGAITTALMTYLKAGDHIVACNPLYSGTHQFLTKFLTKFNVETTWVESGCSVDEYAKSIKPNTKGGYIYTRLGNPTCESADAAISALEGGVGSMLITKNNEFVLYGETPCNPLISILDLEEFGKFGRSKGLITMVDSTYASPYLQKTLSYGIDLSIHSGTKFLSGHSDICAGVISTRTVEQWQEINIYRTTMGNVLSPFEASLLTRGIKTLHIRMDRHSYNAQTLAEFLEGHPKVSKVYYPGLKSHPGHEIAKKQMKAFSGMISFEMKGGLEQAKRLVEAVRLIQFAVSLGGVESLIEHPASMTHGPMIMNDEERAEGWITDGLIRLSVGLEDAEDLKKDLEQALQKA